MKKYSWLLCAAFMAVAVGGLSSCESSNDVSYSKMAYGILEYVSGNYIITTDDQQNLYVTNEDDFENGTFSSRRGRVLVGYNEEGDIDPTKSYYKPSATANRNIEMVAFLSFVMSDIKPYSAMTSEEITAMGDDEINISDVSFGNGYINVLFSIDYTPSLNVEHKLTMVHKDDTTDGKIHLYLMHNAFTDYGGSDSIAINSSFNLYDVLDESDTEADIVLHWWWHASDTDMTLKEYSAEYHFAK